MSYLRSKGLRFTRERQELLKEIMAIHEHFEVDDVLLRLRRRHVGVSQTTIYRTLHLLIDSGLVHKTPCDTMKARYEHVLGHGHHDHMVCVRCGKVIEFSDRRIESAQRGAARRNEFAVLGHRLVISGICRGCR
jgi:Fur family ferric uptake transcriptional regulator